MLKMFSRKFNRKKDYRFLDAEVYRKQRKSLREDTAVFETPERAALKVNFCSVSERASLADIDYFMSPKLHKPQVPKLDQDIIKVDNSPDKQVKPTFHYKVVDSRQKTFQINDIDYLEPASKLAPVHYFDEIKTARDYRARRSLGSTVLPSLGVFSDNKAYSAFVKMELSRLEVDLRHFNHPSSFKSDNYQLLDTIDAWIVFLSDESEDAFLDDFLDRYINKPTLFMVPKTKRKTASARISQFVEELTP